MQNQSGAFNRDKFLCEKFIKIKNSNDLDTVIETGTYHGVTTKWLSENFKNVYTVECNAEFFRISSENLKSYSNIKRKLGSSPDFLKEILGNIDDKKTIIFLDAHWYTNPVLDELDAIKKSGKKPIIAIHDFMVPDRPEFGYDVYPEQKIVYNWEWIQSKIESIYGKNGYIKEYNTQATGAMRGCVFIYPKITD